MHFKPVTLGSLTEARYGQESRNWDSYQHGHGRRQFESRTAAIWDIHIPMSQPSRRMFPHVTSQVRLSGVGHRRLSLCESISNLVSIQ